MEKKSESETCSEIVPFNFYEFQSPFWTNPEWINPFLFLTLPLVSSAKKIVDGLSPSHSLKTKYLKCFYTQPDVQNINNHEDQRLQS